MKIKKIRAVTEPTLLQLTEAGFLDSVKSGLKGIFQNKKPANQQPTASAKLPPPEVDKPTAETEQNDPLGHVVSSLLKPLTGTQIRVVIRVNRSELTSLYLKTDKVSHEKLANLLLAQSESAPLLKMLEATPQQGQKTAQVTPPKQAATTKPKVQKPTPQQPTQRIMGMKPDYSFSDLIKGAGNTEFSILLDVDANLFNKFKKSAIDRRAPFLTDMLDHKYYVMTISNSRAKRLASALDKAKGDLDDEMIAFNPALIVNYPAAQTIKLAKNEWEENYKLKHDQLMGNPTPSQGSEQGTNQVPQNAKLQDLYQPIVRAAQKYRRTDPQLQTLLAQVAKQISLMNQSTQNNNQNTTNATANTNASSS